MFKLRYLIGLTIVSLSFTSFNEVFSQTFINNNENSLTIYNKNFALVKDIRKLKLQKGLNNIEIDDVSALIDPTSIKFKDITNPDNVVISEQNYRYDLISKTKIIDKLVGKTIKFRNNNEFKEGTLLNPATAVYKNSSGSYSPDYNTFISDSFAIKTPDGVLLTKLDDIIIDKLPEGLYARPTLVLKVNSVKQGTEDIEITYLTDGLNWYTDYIALIDNNDKSIDLTGWVTLNNNSGKSYNNASLKLVAGDVRKVKESKSFENTSPVAGLGMVRGSMQPQFNEESLFEYHLYSLDRKTDIKNNETKQLTLISANNVPINKKYVYDPSRNFNYFYSSDSDKKVKVVMEIKNSKSNNLGIPLPKGKVRVYKKDSSGATQFIGEDKIDHTPTDEKLELYIGDAFDITGEKVRKNYIDNRNSIEQSYECTINNHKKESIQVDVYERAYGDWEITENSNKYIKKNANTVIFPVKVYADDKAVITYTIRTKRP